MPEQRRRKRPVPACKERRREAAVWVVKTYSERLRQFYRPCQHAECYPNGESPDVGDRVIRSANDSGATVVHRLAEHEPPDETNTADQDDATLDMTDAQPLRSIGDLDIGDAVTWPAREQPLFVDSTEWPLSPQVTITGPAGGQYTLEEHHDEFWVTHYGRVPGFAISRRLTPNRLGNSRRPLAFRFA